MRTPSKMMGLPYTSLPGCESIAFVAQASLPVAWSNAATYGPMHESPPTQPSPFCVRVTSTYTVPALAGAAAACALTRAWVLRFALFFFARFFVLAFAHGFALAAAFFFVFFARGLAFFAARALTR